MFTWIFLVVLLCVAVSLSVTIGARAWVSGIDIGHTWNALTGKISDPIITARVLRTVTGVIVGSALAMAGAVIQGMTRNPLADSGVLGINSGAAAAIVLGLFCGLHGTWMYIIVGFVGALVVTTVLQLISMSTRHVALTSVLLGAALNIGLSSMISLLLILDTTTLDEFRMWQVGALGRATEGQLTVITPLVIVCAVVLMSEANILNNMGLGDDIARATGVNLTLHRTVMTVGVAIAATSAVAVAGPIGFIGLLVPHTARRLVGIDYKKIIPASLLLGPSVIVIADTLGRVVWPPTEIPVSVAMAIVGAPAFIIMLRKTVKRFA